MGFGFDKWFRSWARKRKISREKPEIWLLEKAQFGYIQIPKVATRSIQQCLASFYVEKEQTERPVTWDKDNIRLIEQKTAFHASHKKLNEVSKQHYIFAFVRNPYDRIYSAYKNKVLQPVKTGERNIFSNHGIQLGMPFDEFIDIVCDIPDNKIDRHLRSQSWFLTYQGVLIPNYIGHLETFDEDWQVLSEKFHLPRPEHRNHTRNIQTDNSIDELNEQLKEKIFNRYRSDFELFGYASD